MNILYIVHPSGTDTAAQTHTKEVVANLRKLGHTVVTTAVCGSGALVAPAERKPLWVRVLRRTPMKWLYRGLEPEISLSLLLLTELSLLTRVALSRKWLQADVMYSRHRWLNLPEVVLSKMTGIPYVKEMNGIVADEAKEGKVHPRLTCALDKVEHWNMRRAHGWMVASWKIMDTLEEDYRVPKSKMTLAQFGADTELFQPDRDGSGSTSSVVCFVGTIWGVPRLDILAKAWPRIKSECPQARAVLVGADRISLEESLEKEVGRDWTFIGVRPREEVPGYINASNVCVGSLGWSEAHRRIGLCSLKLCEYLACGKPVVAARIPGLEFIEESGGGVLIEPENEGQLANAIISLLNNQGAAREAGRRGREYILKERTWLKVAEKIAGALERAAR